MENPAAAEPENNLVPVIVTLVDGETLKGAVSVPKSKSLGGVLNGPELFILFKVNGGELIYLAQKTIAAVQSNKIPEARQLEESGLQNKNITPWEILEIDKSADKKTARAAYHALIKKYHPDQFLNTQLPAEVGEYLEAVILRLNTAYNDLLDEMDRMEKLREAAIARQKQPKTGTTGGINYFGE